MKEINVKSDIKFGEAGEEVVKDTLEETFGCVFCSCQKDYKYDLLMAIMEGDITKKTKIEVKTDKFTTGFLFVEFNWKENPSGIETTESDWYAFYMINYKEIWLIETDKLKRLIGENDFEIKLCGDGKNGKGYRVPMIGFKNHFQVLTPKL